MLIIKYRGHEYLKVVAKIKNLFPYRESSHGRPASSLATVLTELRCSTRILFRNWELPFNHKLNPFLHQLWQRFHEILLFWSNKQSFEVCRKVCKSSMPLRSLILKCTCLINLNRLSKIFYVFSISIETQLGRNENWILTMLIYCVKT
jgi:hypothetical protein